MMESFFSDSGISAAEALGRSAPANPFFTTNYVQAMSRLGYASWVVGLRCKEGVVTASPAFLKPGRLSRMLEIPSLCVAGSALRFWQGLNEFCREQAVTDLKVDTFGSSSVEIPSLAGESDRKSRQEYILDLTRSDLSALLSSNHKRNIKKARAAGISTRCANSLEAVTDHVRLMGFSGARRHSRGESVSIDLNLAAPLAYINAGAGELYQAIRGGNVVSSVLVLKAVKGAYYHSAGTTPEGMDLGASHFLIHTISELLKQDGLTSLNLGGAEADSSLARFKRGFGPSIVQLASVHCYLGPRWKKKLISAISVARGDRRRLARVLVGGVDRYVVYSLDCGAIQSTISLPDAEFRTISAEELSAIEDSEFRQRQISRLERAGNKSSFAIYVRGRLAHVSWLFSPEAVSHEQPAILQLQAGDAEISACETLPEFRGRGLYPFAIQKICLQANHQGIRRIYMKTRFDNKASQSGIAKAGLERSSEVFVVTPPTRPSARWVLRR